LGLGRALCCWGWSCPAHGASCVFGARGAEATGLVSAVVTKHHGQVRHQPGLSHARPQKFVTEAPQPVTMPFASVVPLQCTPQYCRRYITESAIDWLMRTVPYRYGTVPVLSLVEYNMGALFPGCSTRWSSWQWMCKSLRIPKVGRAIAEQQRVFVLGTPAQCRPYDELTPSLAATFRAASASEAHLLESII